MDKKEVQMDYLVWEVDPTGGYCALKYLENVTDEYELKRGISRGCRVSFREFFLPTRGGDYFLFYFLGFYFQSY